MAITVNAKSTLLEAQFLPLSRQESVENDVVGHATGFQSSEQAQLGSSA